MEPKFSGPAYTVGIEEELMILDPNSYALVNAIDDLLEDSPDGEIKPELMESVLEISTNPCQDLREAAASETSRRSRRTWWPASARSLHGGVAISSTLCSSSGLTSPSPLPA